MARKLAAIFIVIWILSALLAPWIAPYRYAQQDLSDRLAGSSHAHWLGTDDLGRDVLTRVLYGGRLSLIIVASALLLALTLGTGVGILAGYMEGLTDHVVGRVIDVLMALPGILLAITILAYVGRGFVPLVVALSATAWVGYARLARSITLSVKQREFVKASSAAGGRTGHILGRHVLPNTMSVLLVQATAGAAGVMLSEAGLSFLGLGVQPPNPSWGEMLATGCDYLLEAPHLAIIPGALLFLTVWALNTLGEDFSRSLAPKRRLLAAGL